MSWMLSVVITAVLIPSLLLGVWLIWTIIRQSSWETLRRNRSTHAVFMSCVGLVLCRGLVDQTYAFVSSILPVHIAQFKHNSALFELDDIRQTRAVLDPELCLQIIQAAEAYGEKHFWTTNRHVKYATVDIPLQVLPEEHTLFISVFKSKITQIFQDTYGQRLGLFSIVRPSDFFVVKYTSDGQRSLGIHMDGGHWSFIVSLNRAGIDFEGGGTKYHVGSNTTDQHHKHLIPPQGSMLSAPAQIFHEGVAIKSGTRYILTGFTKVDTSMNDLVWWVGCYLLSRFVIVELLLTIPTVKSQCNFKAKVL